MNKVGFDNEKYLEIQTEHILERISEFGGKLYLEFGGKLFDDFHASRVLPGFKPDSKVRLLSQMQEQAEIIIVISASDIEKSKVRGDLGITYDVDVLRLIDEFREISLYVGSVVISQYAGQTTTDIFKKRLEKLGVKVYLHYPINGYPSDIPLIVSEDGFGKNEYIETTKPLVVVTAPGPGSGKMATCLSQLYHDHKRGIFSGYAKFETFPIWNLPLNHPVNLAYEAATVDLNDINMIDPFHLDAYNVTAVNYNRDIEVFPVLSAIFEKIYGECRYKSPTDMGVNMVGNCITDNDICNDAAKAEIIRRNFKAMCEYKRGNLSEDSLHKSGVLLNKLKISLHDRKVSTKAQEIAELTNAPAAAIELACGTIVTGKTSKLLGACSAALLNALKYLADIPDDLDLISRTVIEPIQNLKIAHLGNQNPRLHTDEILIALAINAATNPAAELALKQVPKLFGCEAHSTVFLTSVDEITLRKIGINLTCSPMYETNKLYHK